MKYIAFETIDGEEFVVLFSRKINHNDMAESIRHHKSTGFGTPTSNPYRFVAPVGAGFVDSDLTAYGESITLGVESRGDKDTALIKSEFFRMG
jgi:hypothetical protein